MNVTPSPQRRRGRISRRFSRVAVLVALSVCGASALGAHDQARPAGPVVPPTGTGVIAGVVVDAQSQPVANAIVTLTGAELPAGRAAMTAADGRFSFERLPAGRFSLSSSKPAYLKATYGAVRPGGTGTAITLTASEQLTGITLSMPHGGAIAGTIRDAKGQPIPGVPVSVVRINMPAGAGAPRPESFNSDDRGAYRVFGLLPGTYVVMATSTSSGGLGEVGMMSTTEVDATLARLKQRGAAGSTPTKRSSDPSPSSVVRPTRTFTTSPVFFPGVTSAGAATPITLGLGEDRGGVDFVYQLARAAAVTGTVSGAGPTANVQVSLSPDGVTFSAPMSFGAGPMLQRRASTGDGEFTFTNVTPGKYTVLARTTVPAVPGATMDANRRPVSSGPSLYAMTTVEVTDDDIRGIALTLQPTLIVSGRVTSQGTGSTPPPDITKTGVRLVPANAPPADPLGARVLPGMIAQMAGAARADGSFELTGMVPGAYRIVVLGAPAGWWAKSAVLGGRDLLDLPLDIGTTDITGIEVTLSDRRSQLGGRLVQSSGAPASGYFVVAFSADRSLWVPQSRRLRSVRPSTDGQFRFDDLPAGEYYLAALTDADSDDWQSPDFLAQVVASAVRLTLVDGEHKTQDLRIGR